MSMKVLKWFPTRLTMFGCLVLLAINSLTFNISNSAAPVGIYLIKHGAPIQRGTLVLLRNPMKKVAGMPGDTITWAREGVYVNGRLLPNSAKPERSPYPPYPYGTQTLAEGQYLFMGDNPLSWDGRYEGPEPQGLIMSAATLAWRLP